MHDSVHKVYHCEHIETIVNSSAPLKTRNEVRRDFAFRGQSIGAWARSHGYPAQLVYQVLNGRKLGLRGKSHEIAVRLGIKHGLIDGCDLVNPAVSSADSPR